VRPCGKDEVYIEIVINNLLFGEVPGQEVRRGEEVSVLAPQPL
jgi:hypothetical protein